MRVKDLKEVLEQYGDNTQIYVRYTGGDLEVEEGDTFRAQDIEAEYDSLVINI